MHKVDEVIERLRLAAKRMNIRQTEAKPAMNEAADLLASMKKALEGIAEYQPTNSSGYLDGTTKASLRVDLRNISRDARNALNGEKDG